MLSKAVFNVIKARVASHLSEIKELSPADQVDRVALILSNFYDTKYLSPQEIAGFVLLYNTQSGKVKAGTTEHHQLRKQLGIAPVVTVWPFPNAPKSFAQLVSNWAEQYSRLGDAAKTVDFASASSPDGLAAAIRNALDLGGLEDLGDGRELGPSDPVMAMLVKALGRQLSVVYPNWFPEGDLNDTLPEGEDGRSLAELEIEIEAKKAESRALRAKKDREDKRKAELAAKLSARAEIAEALASNADFLSLLSKLSGLGFEETVAAVEPAVVDLAAKLSLNAEHVAQVLFTKLDPKFFREAAEGDLAFRRVAPKPQSTVRRDHATLTALAKLVAKYGLDETKAAIAKVLDDEASLTSASAEYVEAA